MQVIIQTSRAQDFVLVATHGKEVGSWKEPRFVGEKILINCLG